MWVLHIKWRTVFVGVCPVMGLQKSQKGRTSGRPSGSRCKEFVDKACRPIHKHMKASEFKILAFRNVFKVQDKNNLHSEGEGQKQNPIDVDDPTAVSDTDSRNCNK